MKVLLACTIAALIPHLIANPVAAQAPARLEAAEGSLEPSGFWDWIHKLSGPQYTGLGVSLSCGLPCNLRFWKPTRVAEPDWRLRVSLGWYTADEDPEVNPTGAELTMKAIQGAVERRIVGLWNVGRVEGGLGAAAHRFDGEHDTFWRGSLALYPQVRTKRLGVFVLTGGAGIRVFQSFGADAFLPLNVEFDRDGLDAVGFGFFHLAFRL